MKPIFDSSANAIDAACRVACLIVFICVLLVSGAMRDLDMVPSGYGWFGYKILISIITIFPILLLARQAIIIDMIDIAVYQVVFLVLMAIATTGPVKGYLYLTEVLDPVVRSFLFYATVLRLLWLPVFKIQAAAPDWPVIGVIGLLSRHRVKRSLTHLQVAIVWLVLASLIPTVILVGKPRGNWPHLLLGSTGLFLVARYWPMFIRLLGNTIDERSRLAGAMEAAANELSTLKQALANQAEQQQGAVDETTAAAMLDNTITPAERDMLRQIALIHPGIRNELILYILDVCQAARKKPVLVKVG